jgi:hypothetical protein
MGRHAGGGKWLVGLQARRRGGLAPGYYLQPLAPGSLPSTVAASCGAREQHIAIVWTPCRFGGKRPWFQCGRCARRIVWLYIVGGLSPLPPVVPREPAGNAP